MYRSDTILVDSPQKNIREGKRTWATKTHPYTAIVEIEDGCNDLYLQIDSSSSDSSCESVKINSNHNTVSTLSPSPLPLKGKNENARPTCHSTNPKASILSIKSPMLLHSVEKNRSNIEHDQYMINNKSSLKNELNSSVTKRLPNLQILCNRYIKCDGAKRLEIAAQFLVSLVEYSGFPKIQPDTSVFKRLKSQLMIKPETQYYQLSDRALYIRTGASVSRVLRNFLKKNPSLTLSPESQLPKITVLPNNLLDITICLLCVGFRQIRRYVSALLGNIVKFMVKNPKFEDTGKHLLHILVDMRSQDVMSDTRISGYQLLAKHITRIQCNLTELLSRGLRDSSIKVRRLVMAATIDVIKSGNKNDLDITNLLDITLQRFCDSTSVKDRSDIAKFWLLVVENGATDCYNFEQVVLLAKSSDNCTSAFNNFLRGYLRRTICTMTTGDSLSVINSFQSPSKLSTSRIFSVEGLQSILTYIFSITHNDNLFKGVIELGIFTSNLINATWQSFPFLLDLPVIIDMFGQLDNLTNPQGVDRDKFSIVMFSILKQSLKCLINSNDSFISLKNDAIVSFLTSFTSLSTKAESDVCYTLLLESLSRVSDLIYSINYSIDEYLEQISTVIYTRLCAIEYNSCILIHSLRYLQKFATISDVEENLMKFVGMHRQKCCKKSVFVIAHVAHILSWKYVKDILYDTCKMNNDECSSSNLAMLYAIFESGVYAKVKNELDNLEDIQQLSMLRRKIYKISFQLLHLETPVHLNEDHIIDNGGNDGENDILVSNFSILVTSVILLTLQLENLITSNGITQYILNDQEEAMLSKLFFTVFKQKTPVLNVQKSIFTSLVTHQLPSDNVERMQYWKNEYVVENMESCASVLAKLFSMTLNTSLYSSSLGALLLCQLCSKNKQLACCAREFCMLLMKINRTLLYDLLLCVITYKSDCTKRICYESHDCKIHNNVSDTSDDCTSEITEKQLIFIKLCSVFVEITESASMPKDIKRFILNAVNYVLAENPKNSQFIFHIIKIFMKPAFVASPEWNDLKCSLQKSFPQIPCADMITLLTR